VQRQAVAKASAARQDVGRGCMEGIDVWLQGENAQRGAQRIEFPRGIQTLPALNSVLVVHF